jgi:thiosulfate/3-mercaptopyruvate sulfurtransferase
MEDKMAITPVSQRGYANPDLLCETDWLAANLKDADLRIIDTRSAELYDAGHIPGAVSLVASGGVPRSPTNDMGTPAQFNTLAAALGIDAASTVVVYDAPSAAMGMAAWAFAYFGHPRVRMLDGGFAKWTAEGRPVSLARGSYRRGSFEAQPVADLYCSLEDARKSHGGPATVFWDVRSRAEYDGVSEAGNNPRRGHIPGAVHLEWTELLDPETRTFRAQEELMQLLSSRGITPESEINCY